MRWRRFCGPPQRGGPLSLESAAAGRCLLGSVLRGALLSSLFLAGTLGGGATRLLGRGAVAFAGGSRAGSGCKVALVPGSL